MHGIGAGFFRPEEGKGAKEMRVESSDFLGSAAEPPVAPEPSTEELRRLARIIPRSVHLGTSSWAFPGWKGIVWSRFSGTKNLAKEGLRAYSAHPLLTAAGLDRAYYKPLSMFQYAGFAEQVPPDFRFLVKAPAAVTDPMRRSSGKPVGLNPAYLNPEKACEDFIRPATEGLGAKAGPLVFEFAALPREWIGTQQDRVKQIERISAFLEALPPLPEEAPNAFYAVEIRTPAIYTPRFISMLRERGARLVVGLHPSMPDIIRQTKALSAMDGCAAGEPMALKGPLVVRWSLAMGDRFDDARRRYEPFDRIQRPDPVTREGVVELVRAAVRGGQPAFVLVNNKAEGSAPLTVRALGDRLAQKIMRERDAAAADLLMPRRRSGFVD